MDQTTQTAISALADAYGVPEQDVRAAMDTAPTIKVRVHQIARGDAERIDFRKLHADVKLALIGEIKSVEKGARKCPI